MALRRMDNVGIVVEDLEATIAFFRELGLARLRKRGAQLVGEVVQYQDTYRRERVDEGLHPGLANAVPGPFG
jgi:catechol 2,3-dioxygenase-like lactoylglutathione lyase family enzyme